MSEKILVPNLGESIIEATVAKWLKKEGEKISADEPIVELETDKVNLEVPSPITGVLSKIKSAKGSTVEVGAVLGIIEDPSGIEKTSTKKPLHKEKNNVVNLSLEKKMEPKIFDDENNNEEPLILVEEPLILSNEIVDNKIQDNKSKDLSPAVRKIVAEKKIDIVNAKRTPRRFY